MSAPKTWLGGPAYVKPEFGNISEAIKWAENHTDGPFVAFIRGQNHVRLVLGKDRVWRFDYACYSSDAPRRII